MLLADKVVLVTGVGVGIGRQVARAALEAGARVVVAARTASRVEQTAQELDPSGERVFDQHVVQVGGDNERQLDFDEVAYFGLGDGTPSPTLRCAAPTSMCRAIARKGCAGRARCACWKATSTTATWC